MKRFGFIIGIISLLSCQEEVKLDLGSSARKPVIEAVWTDDASLNRVIVTYTRDYYDTLDNEIVKNASVSIKDDASGAVVDFGFVEDMGYYLPLSDQKATVGRQYTLQVLVDGNEYTSNGITQEPPILDSITYEFKEERFFTDEGYYLTVYGKIPFDEGNYYRLLITKNETPLNGPSDYFLFDDRFGNDILNNGFELNGFSFENNDTIKLQMIRLNKNAYDYLNQLVSIIFNDGGLFSPPPENPRSNIISSNGEERVMGYFMTGPVVSSTISIEESE